MPKGFEAAEGDHKGSRRNRTHPQPLDRDNETLPLGQRNAAQPVEAVVIIRREDQPRSFELLQTLSSEYG